MLNAPQKADGWKDWFLAKDSNTIINQAKQVLFFANCNSIIDKRDIACNLEKEENMVFLFHQNFGDRRVNIFHHFEQLGGMIMETNVDPSFIQEVGQLTACVTTPNIKKLCAIPTANALFVSTKMNMFAVKAVTDFKALLVGTATIYRPRNCIPVPPLLFETVVEAIEKSDGDTAESFVKCVETIKEFDLEHTDDNESEETVKDHCKRILDWL